HHLRGPDGVRGDQAQGSWHPPGVRRRDQRPGLHACPAALRGGAMLPELTVRPGEGERWERLAAWLAERIPVEEVDGIWVFRIVRREQKEYGTAIVSLVTGERRRILTASYTATIKGRDRGEFTADMVEVGS